MECRRCNRVACYRFFAMPLIGTCFFCTSGLPCRCVKGQLFGWVVKGVGLQGAQAQFVRVPLADSTLVVIPTGMILCAYMFRVPLPQYDFMRYASRACDSTNIVRPYWRLHHGRFHFAKKGILSERYFSQYTFLN